MNKWIIMVEGLRKYKYLADWWDQYYLHFIFVQVLFQFVILYISIGWGTSVWWTLAPVALTVVMFPFLIVSANRRFRDRTGGA